MCKQTSCCVSGSKSGSQEGFRQISTDHRPPQLTESCIPLKCQQLTDCTAIQTAPPPNLSQRPPLESYTSRSTQVEQKLKRPIVMGTQKERGKYKRVVARTSARANCVYFSRNSGWKVNSISVCHVKQEKYYVAFVKKLDFMPHVRPRSSGNFTTPSLWSSTSIAHTCKPLHAKT